MPLLVIRQAQLDALAEARERELEDRLLDRLARAFDRQYALLRREGMREVVQLGRTRAAEWAIADERHVFAWIAMMLMLGASFDEDPQLPWARAHLTEPGLAAERRVDHTFGATLDHVERVAGDDNEHLVRALVRLRDLDLTPFVGLAGANLIDAMLSTFAHAYPEKAEAQPSEGTRLALTAAVERAAVHGISAGIGAALCCGLAFMIGSGFADDPQVPWVQRTLEQPGSADEKIKSLKREVDRFLAFALSDNTGR
jgi:hypothetical protein